MDGLMAGGVTAHCGRRLIVIVRWESRPTLSLPDNCYLNTLCFPERHTPAERSAVNTPAADSFATCLRTFFQKKQSLFHDTFKTPTKSATAVRGPR